MFTHFSIGFWLYLAGFAGLVLYALIGLILKLTSAGKQQTTTPKATKKIKRVLHSLQ